MTLTVLSRTRSERLVFFRASQRLLWLAATACVVACGGPAADDVGDVVDDFGHRVALSGAARRVVSLTPAITELLFAIGAGSSVVDRTEWDTYPPAVADIPSVGDGLDPNLERVVALRPDLVAFYASNANMQAIQRLADVGVPSVSIRLDSLASAARGARLLGRLTGTSLRADSLARVFEIQHDSVRRAPQPAAHIRVLILSWDNPPIIIGAKSFLSELIDFAGGENVFADVDAPSATVTVETIVARDPEVIIFFADDAPEFADRPEWRTVRAVRDRQFLFLKGSEFEYPSLRVFEAVRQLRRALEEVSR